MSDEKKLRRAQRFFAEHAGGVVGERAAGALALARAEAWLDENSDRVAVIWEYDEEPWESDDGYQPREVLGCMIVAFPPGYLEGLGYGRDPRARDGEILASLWGIADPDRNYQRVVAAELALEARQAWSR